jgi:sporulation protein YlmC with PRC-barrel domain
MSDPIDLSQLAGYTVMASDGDEIGKVDEATRDVTGFIVVNRSQGFGRKLRLSPEHFERVDASKRTIALNLDRSAVKRAPKFDLDPGLGSLELGDTRSMPLTLYPYEAKTPETS